MIAHHDYPLLENPSNSPSRWKEKGSSPGTCGVTTDGSSLKLLPPSIRRSLMRHAICLVFAAGLILLTSSVPALAQDGGGGSDAIQQTLTNVRNYLAALSFTVGGIGFVASLLVKGYASINENAHAYAAMGMKGSLWCIVAGVIVTPILSIAAGLAGGAG